MANTKIPVELSSTPGIVDNSNATAITIDSSENVGIGGSPTNYSDHKTLSLYGNTGTGAGFIEFNDTSGNADAVIFSDDGNLFINADYDNTAASSSIRFRVDGSSEKMRIDSSGAVGIGQVPETARFSGHDILQVGGRATLLGNDTVTSTGQTVLLDNLYYDASGNFQHRGDSRGVAMQFYEGQVIFSNSNQTTGTPTVSERMRIDSVGEVSIKRAGSGGSGVLKALNLNHAGTSVNDGAKISFTAGTSSEGAGIASTGQAFNSADLRFYAGGNTERMRIDSSGNVTIGKTSTGTISTVGIDLRATGLAEFTAYDSQGIAINRLNTDGVLVYFLQDTSFEGDISVSGATVSYNGFSGNHETSGISTDTEIGTVCSTIDELDTYVSGTKSGQTRGDHAKIKVSDTVGDTRVYGVLSSYSERDNKPIVASVGIGSVKVTGACSGGDLLESNGDGTAKVQSDDIVRSKTIGKVTIGNSDTGVKLVSCVLYCG